jgi:hypothetical protein
LALICGAFVVNFIVACGAISVIKPDKMHHPTWPDRYTGPDAASVGNAVIPSKPSVRLPLGVDDQRGAEENGGKGEKDEK